MSRSVLDQLRAERSGETVSASKRGEDAAPLVGGYERISDAYEGADTGVTDAGVKRQEQANEHIAKARGWHIHRHYTDNNLGAFKENVVRDEFEALLSDLEAGVIDGIVVYNLDRFARRVDDLERAIKIYDNAKAKGRTLYFASAEGDLNLSSDDGITLARVMVAFANKSSRDTARRVAAKHRATRDSGRQVSGSRPFGWNLERGTDGKSVRMLNTAEAEAIRWAASGLTLGTLTWREIVREWNARNLLTPNGKRWQPQTVKQVITSPRLAGWLVHKDEIATHSQSGRLIRSDAPAILTDDELEALHEALQGRPGRSSNASGKRKYLLSGLARCAECGTDLRGNAQPEGRFVYKCDNAECGKVTCSGSGLDAYVTEKALPWILERSQKFVLVDVFSGAVELAELEGERESLIDGHATGALGAELVFPRVAVIDSRLEELRHARALHNLTQRQGLAAKRVTAESFAAGTTDEKRAHLAREVVGVYVRPRLRNTGRYFDTDRANVVRVTGREEGKRD